MPNGNERIPSLEGQRLVREIDRYTMLVHQFLELHRLSKGKTVLDSGTIERGLAELSDSLENLNEIKVSVQVNLHDTSHIREQREVFKTLKGAMDTMMSLIEGVPKEE